MPKFVKLDKQIKKVKGRLPAVHFYCRAIKREAANKGIQISHKNALKEAVTKWKSLDVKEKERFQFLSSLDQIRYKSEMTGKSLVRVEGPRPGYKLQKSQRNPHLPRRGSSPFFIYFSQQQDAVRALHPNFTQAEVAKEVSRRWKTLTEAEKEEYSKKARQEKAQYREKLKEYKLLAKGGGMVVDSSDEEENH